MKSLVWLQVSCTFKYGFARLGVRIISIEIRFASLAASFSITEVLLTTNQSQNE